MASHALSGLTGTKESHDQGPENSIKAGSTPMKDGFVPNSDGPTEHIQLLEYYFGHPTSTKKSSGAPSISQW